MKLLGTMMGVRIYADTEDHKKCKKIVKHLVKISMNKAVDK